jgi:hypothetical protein
MPGLVCKPTPLSYSVPVRRPLLRISERNLLASAANGRGFFALWCRFIAAWWDVQRVSPSARRAFASRNFSQHELSKRIARNSKGKTKVLCGAEIPRSSRIWPLLGDVISTAYARVSRDRPMLKAFCRVAPSVRFSFFAILPAGVFFRASDLSVCSSLAVQLRLLEPFFTISFSFK